MLNRPPASAAPPANPDAPDFKWLDQISRFMDSKFTIPGTKIRFGLDPVLGLVPFAGDATSLMISLVLIGYMYRFGASRKLVLLMVGNVVLDAIIGSIPLLGTVFDIYYKPNDRNVRLLKQYHTQGKHRGKGTGLIIAVALFIVLVFAGLLYGFVKLAQWIWSYF